MQAEDAFSEFYKAHYPVVLRFARRRAGEDMARHVAEETMLAAWKSWDRLPAKPLPWLYGTARNQLANARRAAARRARTEQEAGLEPAGGPVTAEESLTQAAPVRQALSQLGPADQELLRLAYWEGLPARDIADVVGSNAGAVAVRLHRARKRLAIHLEHDHDPGGAVPTSSSGTTAPPAGPAARPTRVPVEER